MNSDGISYLDIASNVLRSGPSALVNPHWSPLYPALIAIWESLHRPSPFDEFAYIHALNAVLYAATALAFAYFLRQLIRFRSNTGGSLAGDAIFTAFGFALFFRFMNADLTAFVVTPDLLVAAAVFLAAGLCVRILRGEVDWRAFAALGAVLALGYLAKSAMLPAGVLLLCILVLRARQSKVQRNGLFIAAGVMFLLSAPQILLVSKRVGHFSFSETGRLNYLWWVDGMPFQGWTGTQGADRPLHVPRILERDPKVIEFASPIPGTYPLWYDPTYWFAGAKFHPDSRRQIQVIRNSLRFYRWTFADWRLPLEGLVMLLILAYTGRKALRLRELVFLLWPIMVLSMYALLFTEYRYAAPFLVIFWIAAYSAVLGQAHETERILLALLAVLLLLAPLRETLSSERRCLSPAATNPPQIAETWIPVSASLSEDQIAAQKLSEMGLKPGDPIATVGEAFLHFYARIARVRVIAEVADESRFWASPPDAVLSLEQKVGGTGAKALVARSRPKDFQSALWQVIPGTPYSLLKLSTSNH